MEINYNVLLIFLGSLLTYLGTLSVEKWKRGNERKEKQKNFILLVKQELSIVLKIFDRLKTVQDYKSYYDYNLLSQLDKSVLNLDSYKKEAIYLTSTNQQEILIDLISDISSFAVDTRVIQDLYYSEKKKIDELVPDKESKKTEKSIITSSGDLEKFYSDKKTDKTIMMIEIKRRIDDFVRMLD